MKHLKLIFACLLVTILSIGQVWADDPTVTIAYSGSTTTNMTGNNDAATLGLDATSWSVVGAKGSASNLPGLNKSHYIALYYNANGSNTLTVTNTAGATITSITIAYSGTYNNGVVKVGGNTVAISDGAYPINASSFEITNGNTSNVQVRITSIVITYSGGTTPAVLQSITISGTPTTTSYENGNAFDPTGLVVTGTYDVGDPAAITSGITWTACKTESGTYVALNDEAVALVKDETGIYVKATVGEITSAASHVTGLTVTAATPKVTIDGSATGITTTDEAQTITAGVGSFGGIFKQYSTTALWFTKGSGYIYNTASFGYIRKITINYKSGGAGDAYQWIKMGSSAMDSYEAASTNGVKYETSAGGSSNTFVVDGDYEYFCLSVSNKNLQASSIVIEYDNNASAPKAATPTFPTGDENFLTSTSVTLACETSGATIYYTTDGTAPTTSSSVYSAAIPVSATTTIKAMAAATGMDNSNVAEKTFTKIDALTTMAAVQAAAEGTEKAINVVISNWVVTGVSGSYAWISDADNTKGIMLYKSSHGFTAGKKLNGTVVGTKIQLYSLFPELKSLVATDVTVTDATAITPRVTTIAALTSGHPAEQGTVVKLEGVTYSSSTSKLSDGVNSIAADNKLFSSLALVDGTTYDITGVVTYYKESEAAVVKIAPRSAADVEAQSPVVIPTAANLAALKAAARGTYILTLTNAVVTYVNGNNAFIEDATGGALIYFASHGYSAGDCLNGDYQVVTTDYQGKFEITAMEPQTGAAKTTAEIPLTTVTIATLNANFSSYESRRIKIVGANVTDAIKTTDRNGAINDGAALAVYAAVASTITLNADDNVDIIGYPGFHNTDQQLNVWAQADITVNEKDPAGISFTPESETITGGDPWSAPAFANPNNLDVTFGSDDETVATVSNTGVVSLEGGYGTAVITAHTNGDATHSAGNATYTITVNDPSAAPVYTMSFDMTRASYDDAGTTEVIWNSNVVTMTAAKGTASTNTNSYIGGGYNNTALCTQTRFYKNSTLTFAPKTGVQITKVEYTGATAAYANALNSSTWSNATTAVDGSVVTITPTDPAATFSATISATTGATLVKVYYEAESEKSKLAASVSIANINTAVGEDDILLSSIAATSNPNKNAISYEITSGSEYVSLTGEGKDAAFHALAEGTATITATIPNDLGNYTGATTTFNIVVAAAPATLSSIAISGTASVLEYSDGQNFNPAGLVVTGTYSDASTAPISEGITWAFDPSPLTEGTTSVSVTATVGEINSPAFVVNGLTVGAAAAPTTDNVVILASFENQLYAMSTSNSSSTFAAVMVEEDGSNIVVPSEEAKTAIQWTRATSGENTTFQNAEGKYMSGVSNTTSLTLADAVCNWSWDGKCYVIGSRSFFYRNNGFKNYGLTNAGKSTDGYSGLAEVRVIAAENIIVTSKANPQLAYNPTSVTLTVGGTFTPATLTYASGFDGLAAVTYVSSNPDLATIEGGVVSLVADATGSTTITASFPGNTNYLAGSASYTITVNEAGDDLSGTWTLVTDAATLAVGKKVIIAQHVDADGAINTMAGQASNNRSVVASSVAGTTLTPAAGTKVMTLANAGEGKFYLKTSNDQYLYNASSSGSSFLRTKEAADDASWTIEVNAEGVATITSVENTNRTKMRYNPNTSGNPLFNCYTSGQSPIALYMQEEDTPEPADYTEVRTGLTVDRYYTTCLPRRVTAVKGATFWNLSYRNAAGTVTYIDEATLPFEAGTPFLFQATAAKLEVVYEGDAVTTPVENGALRGILEDLDADAFSALSGNVYVLKDNAIRPRTSGNYSVAERAYILYDELEVLNSMQQLSGRRVRTMPMEPMEPQVTTGINEIQVSDKPVKVMIDGQLFILRGDKRYDATGRLVE